MKHIAVLLAEDHMIVREGFRKLLEAEDDLRNAPDSLWPQVDEFSHGTGFAWYRFAGRHGVFPDLGTAAVMGSWSSSSSNACCRVRSSGMRRKSLALVTESTRLVISSNRLLV